MFQDLEFEPIQLPENAAVLRQEVRDFLSEEMPRNLLPNSDFGAGDSVEFSRKLGKRGWIGMT